MTYAYSSCWHNPYPPSPPSPSRLPDEDFLAWKDRMHKNPPTVAAGEQYVNEGVITTVIEVSEDTVIWSSDKEPGQNQHSYRITFEEWAVSDGTAKVNPPEVRNE